LKSSQDPKRGAPLFESTMNLKEIKLDLGTELLRLYLEKEGAQECNLIVLLKQLLESLPEPLTDDEKKTLFQNVTSVESGATAFRDTWLSLGLDLP
jgi:hypothetical protein